MRPPAQLAPRQLATARCREDEEASGTLMDGDGHMTGPGRLPWERRQTGSRDFPLVYLLIRLFIHFFGSITVLSRLHVKFVSNHVRQRVKYKWATYEGNSYY